MRYKTLVAHSAEAIDNDVNDHLKLGWELHGPQNTAATSADFIISQAMVRQKELTPEETGRGCMFCEWASQDPFGCGAEGLPPSDVPNDRGVDCKLFRFKSPERS